MSGTGEQIELPETLIEQDGAIPETVEIPEEKPTEAEAPEGVKTEEVEAKPAEEPVKPKIKPWYQKRIDELSALRAKEREEKDALAAKLATFEKPDPDAPQTFKPEQFQDLIRQEARNIVAQESYLKRAESWVKAGKKEFGDGEFDSMCADVASMGVGDSPEFMQIITDPEIVPEGHKVIAMLREDPDTAERILAMPPMKMSAALALMSTKEKPAAPAGISKAPRPITPVGGSAKPSGPNETQDIKTWMAERNKSARVTPGGKPNTH
jgi:hypothetical protein